jgi:hypothetical protein
MAYTKRVARHDRISIDGTDVSNAFNEFHATSADSQEDASGFSVSGSDETLPGSRAQGFNGTMFVTEEIVELVWPIHANRELVEIQFQPNGLIDSTAMTWYGNCYILELDIGDVRGSVSTTPFTAVAGDEDGITFAATGT